MKNKKQNRIFPIILLIFFAIFITIYVSNEYGYFEYKKREQVTLTQEQIKQFESDIKNGHDVLLENYVPIKKNYQTKFSQFGLNVSNFLASTVKKGVDGLFEYIGKHTND